MAFIVLLKPVVFDGAALPTDQHRLVAVETLDEAVELPPGGKVPRDPDEARAAERG
jgi:hypothetical protein